MTIPSTITTATTASATATKMATTMITTISTGTTTINNNDTGVCKINGVVIVADCCYSIGFSTTNNKNTVYFANTGNNNNQL